MTDVGPMLNAGPNAVGDCTIAAAGHQIQSWTANAGRQFTPPDANIMAAYEEACGYNPADPSTDQGGDMLTVLKYLRSIGIAGHKIGAFASIQPTQMDVLRQVIYLFGGAYTGFDLPKYCEDEDTWDVAPWYQFGVNKDGVDGHCIPILGYDEQFFFANSWGTIIRITGKFVTKYCSEAYALLSEDQLNVNGLTPPGFNNQQMAQDLRMVAA